MDKVQSTHGQHPMAPTGDQRDFEPKFGLTKREYFAGRALQGIASNPKLIASTDTETARVAVNLADALIDALNIENNGQR